MNGTQFIKMHGLGNDFVVLDGRAHPVAVDAARVRAIADRHVGVGCDQLIVIEPAQRSGAAARMRIYNADGGEIEACGNATRCIGSVLMAETGAPRVAIETIAGLLAAETAENGCVAVDMGEVRLDWNEIPMTEPADTLHVAVSAGPLSDAVAVNVGNPHAVFFVADAEAVAMETFGPEIEHHPMFPQRTNVEAVSLLGDGRLRMRVWERGVGVTRACGTGACASLVAAHRRGLAGRSAEIVLDGGALFIEWLANGHVRMTGPVATVYTGTLVE